ncbi:amidohydrolase [soil metagenome]
MAGQSTKIASDLILLNGSIYTVDASRSWTSALAVKDGKIIYLGPESEIKNYKGPNTTVFDLKGKMVLPGFHDSHVHPVSGGLELGECDLTPYRTEDQMLEHIIQYARQHPEKEWIRGGGWQLPLFKDGNPHKSILDRILPDRPVYLEAADGHSAWVNSRALALANIDKKIADPENGRIERDHKSAAPTGTLREDAMKLVSVLLPKYSEEDYIKGLKRGMEIANRYGITSLYEASATENLVKAYAALDERGELKIKVTASLKLNPKQGEFAVKEILTLRDSFNGHNLNLNAVKIYADGVIEAQTAALIDPYLGTNGKRGKPTYEPEELKKFVKQLDKEGFQVHIHAIGDYAVRISLDAFEFSAEVNGKRDSRHHIAHLQLIHPKDRPRFRRLGVVANFQPLWAYSDVYINKLTEPFLGPERSRWIYPIGSMLSSGATVVAGSDWSVSSMNPLLAMQVAVTRRALHAGPGPAWLPEEVADLPSIIASYTINGAYLSFQEKETGSIEVGKAADLVVLDRDLFEIPPHEIHLVNVMLTVLDGKIIYQDPSFE